MPLQSPNTAIPKRACAASGPVYVREAAEWSAGELRAERTGLRFTEVSGEYTITLAYAQIRRAHVLSAAAAALDPGCFEVVVDSSAFRDITSDGRLPALSSRAVRFQAGSLGTAAHWVGVIDDAAAAAADGDEAELRRWWAETTSQQQMQLPFHINGTDECDLQNLPGSKPFEVDVLANAMRSARGGNRAPVGERDVDSNCAIDAGSMRTTSASRLSRPQSAAAIHRGGADKPRPVAIGA